MSSEPRNSVIIPPPARLQRQRQVIAELSIFDSRVAAVDSLIDIGPTPAYRERNDVHWI